MTLNANADNVDGAENLSGRRSKVLTVDAKNQETLTLVESLLDNYDEYSRDEQGQQEAGQQSTHPDTLHSR